MNICINKTRILYSETTIYNKKKFILLILLVKLLCEDKDG